MRFIDRWVGVPLCFLLTLMRPLLALVRPRRQPEAPQSILLIHLTEMGITVPALPALAELKRRYPQAGVQLVVLREFSALVHLIDWLDDDVFVLRGESVFKLGWDTMRFMVWCRRRRIDTVINLGLFTRITAALTFLTPARRRVGFWRFHEEGLYLGRPYTHRVAYNLHRHISQMIYALVEALQRSPSEVPLVKAVLPDLKEMVPRRVFSDGELAEARALVQGLYPDFSGEHRLVIFNANTSDLVPLRRWPDHRFVELARRLLEREDVLIVLTGAPGEVEAVTGVARMIGHLRCLNAAGKTTLPGLLALYQVSDVLVTNDSGPAQFAALTDIHIVVMFGPETPELYGPMGEHMTVLYKNLACSPCVSPHNQKKSPCEDNICLKSITVDEVRAAIDAALAGKRQ
ncbi:MAG: glycosyltransferase family 9 protein [Proteobacteria bacterium]|nr:glycosyltransferase family 9 protein [Pseudomonadota bacterium]